MSNNSKGAVSKPKVPLLRRIPKVYVLAALGVLLLFDLVFYFVAVQPLGRQKAEQQALVEALEKQVADKQAEVEQLQLVVSKVEKARSEGDVLLGEITLPRRSAFSVLIGALLEAAGQSGINTREGNFDIEPIEGTEEYGTIAVDANFRGRYDSLVQFLNEIDRSEQFLILDSLAASPRSDSNELQITMRLNALLRELLGS